MLTKTSRFIRIIYFTFVMLFGTHAIVLVLSPIWIICTLFFPRNIPRFKVCFGRLLFVILIKQIHISGFENIEKENRYLIVSNYPSGYVGFVLMMLFPEASIIVHSFMGNVPIVSAMLTRYGFIYAYKQGFRRIRRFTRLINVISQNSSIIILPEGKSSRDGRIHEFKRGFIHILRHNSLDLVPVTLNGFNKLKPMGRPYLDPDANLEVVIHKPINTSTIKTINDKQLTIMVLDSIKSSYKP